MATKYDYKDLERQYVRGEMSIRQLCRDNGVKTWSTVSEYAKRNDWDEKRADFRSRLQEAEVKSVIEKRADALGKALDDGIMIANQALYAFLDSLKGHWVTDPESGDRAYVPGQTVSASEFVKILEKIMVLNGQVTSREAHLSLSAGGPDFTMEMFRDLAAAARAAGADADPVPSSPLPRLEGSREVDRGDRRGGGLR